MDLLRTKSIEAAIADTEEQDHRLRRELGPLQLTVFGVGVIIGAGIFVLTGEAAATRAGPAVAISFTVAAIACALAALCYAEFASTVPVSGSAYTFSYASLGELIAWIIGWDLVLELALGAATVASGWSGYLASFLDDIGMHLPAWVTGTGHNVAAAAIVAVLCGVTIAGVRLSARFNATIVAIKLAIVLLVIAAGITYVKTGNWSPFVPASHSGKAASGLDQTPLIDGILGRPQAMFGFGGIITGAALVFFAFIGFDIVATAAEETKKPQRDMPIGIFGSLAICTALYVAVSLVVTGMVRYDHLSTTAPLSEAFKQSGNSWAPKVIDLGALAGLTSVILILLYGQSRVLFAMSRDHLLPPWLAHVHPRLGTPYRISALTGIFVAVLAFLLSLTALADLVNIGTLFAFVLVAAGVIALRRTQPGLKRAFRTPLVPLVPILAILACLYLMLNLFEATWIRFGIWLVVGLVVYFGYSVRKSRLAGDSARGPVAAPATR
jgi:APA family basic amino acid/polyamine antiporter